MDKDYYRVLSIYLNSLNLTSEDIAIINFTIDRKFGIIDKKTDMGHPVNGLKIPNVHKKCQYLYDKGLIEINRENFKVNTNLLKLHLD